MIYVDENLNNADWIKLSWNLPIYKSEQFYRFIKVKKMNIEQFRKLPVYKNAVIEGLIKNDEWVGKINDFV